MSPKIEKHRRKLDQRLAELRVVKRQIKEEKEKLSAAATELSACEEAQRAAQAVAQTVQQLVHERIAGVVSKCLSCVFDEPYALRISFERKRGKTEARLLFERDGKEIDPLFGAGGGTVDVAAFALRVAALILTPSPGKSSMGSRRLLVLDEPLKHLSAEYRPQAAALLESLAKEFDVQIILSTHSDEFKVGKIIQL